MVGLEEETHKVKKTPSLYDLNSNEILEV